MTSVGSSGAQHQRARRRIDDREIHERSDVVAAAFEQVCADDGEITHRKRVLILVRDLVIGNERHDVYVVEALHAFETGKAALVAQVIIGNHDDVAHELAIREAHPDTLQQLLAARRFEACCEPAVARRQEGEADPHGQLQLRHGILRRRRLAFGIEEIDEAR